MHWSNSKLNTILTCPMTYFLKYRMGITRKEKKKALKIGSAVHWGIEHNNSHLEEYYKKEENYREGDAYTSEQSLAEVMVSAYLDKKETIMNKILEGEKILEEVHELTLTSPLPSKVFKDNHEFLGIIDMLLLTNKGVIIIDFKTSTNIPNYNDYLDQIYRYVFLSQSYFPDVPVYKIGIINIRKSTTKQMRGESHINFFNRLKKEYNQLDDMINLFIYPEEMLKKDNLDLYINHLIKDVDRAALIDLNNIWITNYQNLVGKYGRSDYYEILTHQEYSWILYNIEDKIYDKEIKKYLSIRDCREIDTKVIDKDNVLNKYETFRAITIAYYSLQKDVNKKMLFEYLKRNYITDDFLLERYWVTMEQEIYDQENKKGGETNAG